MTTNYSLIHRYEKKMNLVPVYKGYPFLQSNPNDNLISYCYGIFKSQSYNEACKIILEFDKGNPAQGIYFGCQLKDNTVSSKTIQDWGLVVDIIKRDLALYWRSVSTAENRILEWDFKDRQYNRYWPFWIRLEDNEEIFEAIRIIEFIICSLKAQGFKKIF